MESSGFCALREPICGFRLKCPAEGVGGGAYSAAMSLYRLLPTAEQEAVFLAHCRDARYVWNLAVEQQQHWQPGRKTVQQQALRDFAHAMQSFFAGTHRRPTWRKAGVHEGFR